MISVKCAYPVVTYLIVFLSDCYHVFDSADVSELEKFMIKYKDSAYEPIGRYIAGMETDIIAVKNSLIYSDISNGPTEGNNSRIKMLHRRSGGRAGLDLLNAYAVLAG
jgi:transposase